MSGEDPEDLRRRLYRRDASPADLQAYTAITRVHDPVDHPRRHRRNAILLPVAALALAATALVLAQPSSPAPTASRVPSAVPDVQRAAVVASTTEAERDGFVRALSSAGSADLTAWAGSHGRVADLSAEYRGTGRGVLGIAVPQGGGRVDVLLVASRTASVSWTLLVAGAHGTADVPIDRRSLYVTPGDVAEGVLRYPAGRVPVRLLVTAPARVRWSAAVLANG